MLFSLAVGGPELVTGGNSPLVTLPVTESLPAVPGSPRGSSPRLFPRAVSRPGDRLPGLYPTTRRRGAQQAHSIRSPAREPRRPASHPKRQMDVACTASEPSRAEPSSRGVSPLLQWADLRSNLPRAGRPAVDLIPTRRLISYRATGSAALLAEHIR